MSQPTATTPIGDVLRQIAQRTAPADRSPLLHSGELTVPDAAQQNLPLAPEFAVAWRALLADTGAPWQAELLATARRGLGVALVAPPPLGITSLLLIAAEQIQEVPNQTLLLLAPDQTTLNDIGMTARNIDALLGGSFPHLVVEANTRPPRNLPPLVMMTYETLHQRVLRSHQRGWSQLINSMTGVILPALDLAAGTALGHTRWLLRRLLRLRPMTRALMLYTSVTPMSDIELWLATVVDNVPPLIVANTSRTPLTWALWHGGTQPLETAVELAQQIRQSGLTVQLDAHDPLERALVAQRGASHGLSIVQRANAPSHMLIMLGGVDSTSLPSLAASGYRAIVLITDDSIAAHVAIKQPALLTPNTPPTQPIASHNAYVSSGHVRCAAEERPISATEVAAWEIDDLIERMENKHLLAYLANSATWQPVAAPQRTNDVYMNLHPATASDAPVSVVDDKNQPLAAVDPVVIEQRLYPGAVVLGGRVSGWNDDGSLAIQGQSGLRTVAERRCTVTIRETMAERSLDGGRADTPLHIGRVVVNEHVLARRSMTSDGGIRRVPFDPPLQVQWSAPAVWIAAQTGMNIGEMIAGVLPLLLRCRADDVVPCVSDNMLFIVETQPGGRGIVEHLYTQFEPLLHLAGLAARTLVDDALVGANAKAELAWMETVLMPLAVPLRADIAPEPQPASAPSVERRARHSMVISATDLAARRRMRGQTFGVPRSLPKAKTKPEEPPAPPPIVDQGLPSQPMRLPAQTPQPVRQQPPARRLTRNEAPPPPLVKAKIATPRPSRRGATREEQRAKSKEQGFRSQQVSTSPSPLEGEGLGVRGNQNPPREPAPPPQTKLPIQPPPKPVERSAQTMPTRREPPPFERPPFQNQKSEIRNQNQGAEGRRQNIEHRTQNIEHRQGARGTGQQDAQFPSPREGSGVRGGQNQPRPNPPAMETSSDPNALLEKARRLREQREAQLRREQPPVRRVVNSEPEIVESRYKPQDRIFCVPYGEGVVLKSRVRDGRELLLVQFPELGDLRVDPAVNAVRLIAEAQTEDEDYNE